MRVTRFRLIALGLLLAVIGVAGVVVSLRHEPDFYRRAAVSAGPKRAEMSHDFFTKEFAPFVATFKAGIGQWQFNFSQDHLNSFFEEDFVRFGDADQFRKIGITNPRVEFTEDMIRVGFRFGGESWSTVLSYDLKVWLAPSEPNVLAVEILRRRAGALPIPTQQIFSEIKDLGRRHDIDIEWYRHNGNPVAIVKFQHDRPRPTALLQRLEIGTGRLELHGLTLDPGQSLIDEPIRVEPTKTETAP